MDNFMLNAAGSRLRGFEEGDEVGGIGGIVVDAVLRLMRQIGGGIGRLSSIGSFEVGGIGGTGGGIGRIEVLFN